MLNEERVKLMTKIAIYENKYGKDDLTISSYYRKDYTSFQVICTILRVTIGYFLLVGLAVLANIELLLETLSVQILIIMGIAIVTGYLLIIIIYGVLAHDIYKNKHHKARHRVKKFNRDLTHLKKMYEKEK